jgi:hypothetical protein
MKGVFMYSWKQMILEALTVAILFALFVAFWFATP